MMKNIYMVKKMNPYKKNGSLEIICGSMFSGKSEELIRRMRRAIHAKQSVQIFKHSLDNRHTMTHVHAHSGDKIQATPVMTAEMLLESLAPQTHIIGIDEVQFFEKNIILVIDQLVRDGKHVIAAGLDLDFRGIPFGPMPSLLALADDVTKLKAVCMKNGSDAHFTQRIVNGKPASYGDSIVFVGAEECYEARSRECFEIDYVPLSNYVNSLSL